MIHVVKNTWGDKFYFKNDLLHGTDGPAVERFDRHKEYWLNGKWYIDIRTDEEWLIFQIVN